MSDGERWKQAREEAGYSVQEAADALGLHRNTIYKLETGDEAVTLRLLNRVAMLYGTTLGRIYRDAAEPERTPREFRPLLEPLRPLTQEQREKVIKNIASNLDYMAMTYANVPATEGREIRPAVTPEIRPRTDEPYNPVTQR